MVSATACTLSPAISCRYIKHGTYITIYITTITMDYTCIEQMNNIYLCTKIGKYITT